MKTVFFLLTLLLSFQSFALTRTEIDQLLAKKKTSLPKLETQGAKLLPGEVTGHGKSVSFSKVAVLLTDREAILKSEIESVEFDGVHNLENIQTIRFNGQYISREDVKATIILGQ
ncbi:MAG TPA: hypothetical protein VNJ01_10780 [Bacteriovoracaceae bacterium]|nr:hypothetical protein [Bacteriovoracaceae bacterium]